MGGFTGRAVLTASKDDTHYTIVKGIQIRDMTGMFECRSPAPISGENRESLRRAFAELARKTKAVA